jgi:hypothetical protein
MILYMVFGNYTFLVGGVFWGFLEIMVDNIDRRMKMHVK